MLETIATRITEKRTELDRWFAAQMKRLPDPIYASVDIRNAGYKVAPVDTNIFPAGFNNLCPSYRREAAKLLKAALRQSVPDAMKVLIIPEEHTRNTFYFENLFALHTIVRDAGFETLLGTLNPELAHQTVQTADNKTISFAPIDYDETRKRLFARTKTRAFDPDIALINNDFAVGISPLLRHPISQPLLPTPHIGWHWRRKSDHFRCYSELVCEFANILDIDTFHLCAAFETMEDVDFFDERKRRALADRVDAFIEKLRPKYKQHNIPDEPFAFVKNESGTYGMGIMTAFSGDDIRNMNRKAKNKMSVAKGNVKITDVIIQEGLPTVDRFKGLTAEPVMYLVGNRVCGGFFRMNATRDIRENLNAPGMQFSKLCFHEMFGYSNEYRGECDLESLDMIYRAIARVASLAAGCEILHTEKPM